MAIQTTIFYIGGSLVTPVRACPHFGTAEHPWVQLENCDCSIISLECSSCHKVSPRIVSPKWGKAMGANHGELGDLLPSPKLTPKTTLRYREIHDSYIKAGIHPEFFQRELAAAKPRRVSKSRLQPANHSHFV